MHSTLSALVVITSCFLRFAGGDHCVFVSFLFLFSLWFCNCWMGNLHWRKCIVYVRKTFWEAGWSPYGKAQRFYVSCRHVMVSPTRYCILISYMNRFPFKPKWTTNLADSCLIYARLKLCVCVFWSSSYRRPFQCNLLSIHDGQLLLYAVLAGLVPGAVFRESSDVR